MNNNHVVIYSNGIADFQRVYEVSSEAVTHISIPVRQDHLADVLSSFNVYGDVKLETPPTYRPSNELEGNITLDPTRVMEDLATNLSGARVRIERAGGQVEGTLVGLHQEQEATAGEPIQPKSLIVLTTDGLRRCPIRETQSLQFLDEEVQAEINKALQRNYQRIKPNSTFVELELSTTVAQTPAVVQYTIPAAAWKISYRLRMEAERPTELQGFAIVDNNTDEDWIDFLVSVVTGEPITFSTDLADSKTPRRNHMNLVREQALGAVEVEEAVGGAVVMAAESIDGMQEMRMQKMSTGRSRLSRSRGGGSPMEAARTETADVHEVGDFSVFESNSTVTIPAKRSTVIPVFNVAIDDIKSVLHYKYSNHVNRPYRSVDFTNRSSFSLSRGVCTVYEEQAYAGNCIIPALKPGESRLLPHALETGVHVERDMKRARVEDVALRISAGTCYKSNRQWRENLYQVKNGRDKSYSLVLDHGHTFDSPQVEIELIRDDVSQPIEATEKLADGVRCTIELEPKAELIVKVIEHQIAETKIELVEESNDHRRFQIDWLQNNVVNTNGPLANHDGIRQCLQIHRQVEAIDQQISDAVQVTERLAERQERVRKNLQSGGQDELTNRWRGELDETEREIRTIEEQKVPELRQQAKELRQQLRDAIMSLSAEWSKSP